MSDDELIGYSEHPLIRIEIPNPAWCEVCGYYGHDTAACPAFNEDHEDWTEHG